jgi:putative ribosome biogenesis GTPase RsgA
VSEPDCAVRAAAERGDLSGARLRSYYRLMGEVL